MEDLLLQEIKRQYGSIKAVSNASGVAYTTVRNIIKRGVLKSGITPVCKVCEQLHISVQALAEGRIEHLPVTDITDAEIEFIHTCRQLNDEGLERLKEYAVFLQGNIQYRKGYIVTIVEADV